MATQLTTRLIVPLFVPDATVIAMLGSLAGALVILIWWLFLSRAAWIDRLGGIILMAVSLFAARPWIDRSIAGGMMGLMFWFYSIPFITFIFGLAIVLGRNLPIRSLRILGIAALLFGAAFTLLLRVDGITGEGSAQFAWRWSKDAEQKLITSQPLPPPPPPADRMLALPEIAILAAKEPPPELYEAVDPRRKPPEWPGFRGPERDGLVRDVRIRTDWKTAPPAELWRKPVGPGWSSFAVDRDRIFTQEQRGDSEVVACYDRRTGKPVWAHRDPVRFYESNGGAGPRATPTVYHGRVYSLGATGILNVLSALNGARIWSRNAVDDTGAKIPGWGISGSPLIAGDRVVVAANGRLAAYDLNGGAPKWTVDTGEGSYSSPQLLTITGLPQVVMPSDAGATGVSPADGKVLWKYAWPGTSILQPAVAPEGGLLLATGDMGGGVGVRRLTFTSAPEGWKVDEKWTSRGLKPYFNDFVVHRGHAFGFDGSILSCIDLQDGHRVWKGGRYGNGQMIALADQDVLVVLSEEGDVALVSSAPDQFNEIAKIHAIDGKTWNHPVIAGDTLLVRNGQEMAAFRLTLEK